MTRLAQVSVPSRAESLLHLLGAGSPLAEDIIGDLAEEYAERRARDGDAAARRWYAREALRSTPHLLRTALTSGTEEGRLRLLVLLGLPAAITTAALLALLLRPGAPTMLVAGHEGGEGRVVVSNMLSARIPLRVMDEQGRTLPDSGVRFAREHGKAAVISEEGVARCTRPGDVMVRATLGRASTRFTLSCQPINQLYVKQWYNVVLGGAGEAVRVGGYDTHGDAVTRVAATYQVDDPAVATVERDRIVGHAPGRTFVYVSTGERAATAAVTVFEPVASFAGLRAEQRYVIAPVRLAPGAMEEWPLPAGRVWLVNQVDRMGDAPALSTRGPVSCEPALAPGVYRARCTVGAGASLTLTNPRAGGAALEGAVALERDPPARR